MHFPFGCKNSKYELFQSFADLERWIQKQKNLLKVVDNIREDPTHGHHYTLNGTVFL